MPWISRLEAELDNIRAALDRALAAGEEAEAASLALAMGWFWWLRNYRHEGMEWLDRTLRLGVALDVGGGVPSGGEPEPPGHIDHFLAAPPWGVPGARRSVLGARRSPRTTSCASWTRHTARTPPAGWCEPPSPWR
ncbi:hypothetical protein ACFWAZ_11675 [Streptomyces collinus]|uniref:hypothetical protein n=1 Tax=Streptomyces collinus TaxID=42684 RepID=UPI003652FE4A